MITPVEPVRRAEHTGVVSAPGGAMEGNEEAHANMTRIADRMSLWLGKPIITNAGIPSLFSYVQFVGCSPLVYFLFLFVYLNYIILFLLRFACLFLYTEFSVVASFVGHFRLWHFGRNKHSIGNSHQPSFRKLWKRVFVFTHICVGRIISSQCALVLFLLRKWPLVIRFLAGGGVVFEVSVCVFAIL